jgi:hypothetical protein
MVEAIPNRNRMLSKRISSSCSQTCPVDPFVFPAIRTYLSHCRSVRTTHNENAISVLILDEDDSMIFGF